MLMAVSLTFQIADQLRKVGMSDMWDNHADGIRGLLGKRARHLIRVIIQFFHCIVHLLARLLADVSAVI